jgi:vancomycin resistance protein YoaR
VRRTGFVVALFAGLVVVFGLAFAGSPERLAAGTEIAGVDVGGLSTSQASAELSRRAREVERIPVRFTAGGKSWTFSASQLGVRVDWDAAVRVAGAEGDGIRPVRGLRRIQTRLFGTSLEPTAGSFESVVAYEAREIAKSVDVAAAEPAVRRTGSTGTGVVVVPGRAGTRFDVDAATVVIVRARAALERGEPVALPVVADVPRLGVEDLEAAAAQARIALSAPLVLRAGATRLKVSPQELTRLVRLPSGGRTTVDLKGPKADRWIAELQARVNRPARDATFRVRPGGISVVPAADGRTLDVGATVEAIRNALVRPGRRIVPLFLVSAAPARSTAEARAMGIAGVVGSYTTTYGGSEDRLTNVRLVAELIDGALVAPGATFSFNATTGERNAAKGFREAPVIINGELSTGIGGGVCQVSTTIFNAAFEAGLPIGTRTNHALYISHYPLGRDATVNYPDIDLTFSNDTGRWLLVRTFVGAGSLTVNLYGTPQGRRVESETSPLTVTGKIPIERSADPAVTKGTRLIDQVGTPPRETRVLRRVYDRSGELLYENTWASFYRAEPTLVRVGMKPKPKPVVPATPGSTEGSLGPPGFPDVTSPTATTPAQAGPATPTAGAATSAQR